LNEDQIKKGFVQVFNDLVINKVEVIKDCENMILKLIDTKDIDIKILKFQEKSETLVELMKSLIYENSRKAMNQDKYNQKYNSYTEKYEKIKNKILKLREEKQDLKIRQEKIKIFIKNLKENNEIISEISSSKTKQNIV